MEVGCVHIAEYPAWVRCRLAPSQPLVGVYARGRVVAASPALRRAGLEKDENVDRARTLFPRATFHEQDRQLENAMWEDVLTMLYAITPNILSLQPGWALVAPWDRDRLELFNRSLGGHVGIASRRLITMLAALQVDAGDMRDVPVSTSDAFLDAASVRHLGNLAFADEIIERLELFGLKTIGSVAGLTRRHLHGQFGKVGTQLYELLHPSDDEPPIPLYQPPPTVTVTHEFDPAAREPVEIMPIVKMLIQQGVDALGGLQAQRIAIRLRGPSPEGLRLGSRILKAPTGRAYRLYANAEIITRGRLDGSPVETISIELGGLIEPAVVQCSLFHTRADLYEAVRMVHRRYPGVLLRAIISNPDAYIAEEGISYEPYPDAPPKSRKRRRAR